MKKAFPLAPGWMALSALALAMSIAHVLVDMAVGFYGRSSSYMSPLQAANIIFICLMYAYWVLSLAWTNTMGKAAIISVLILSTWWSFLSNGVFGVMGCPPPCHNAFPYQDIAHFANALFGGLATYTTWQAIRSAEGPIQWLLPVSTIVLVLISTAVTGALLYFK